MRVTLHEFDEKTIKELLPVAEKEADPLEVLPPIGTRNEWSQAHAGAFLAFHRTRRTGLDGPHGEITYLVRADRTAAGAARLKIVGSDRLEADLWIARRIRGKSVGTEAFRELLDIASKTVARVVVAETMEENEAAVAMLKRAGARMTAGGRNGQVVGEVQLR